MHACSAWPAVRADQEKVAALMVSIQEIGLQEPIDVLLVDGVYYGFSGCHRYEVGHATQSHATQSSAAQSSATLCHASAGGPRPYACMHQDVWVGA